MFVAAPYLGILGMVVSSLALRGLGGGGLWGLGGLRLDDFGSGRLRSSLTGDLLLNSGLFSRLLGGFSHLPWSCLCSFLRSGLGNLYSRRLWLSGGRDSSLCGRHLENFGRHEDSRNPEQ